MTPLVDVMLVLLIIFADRRPRRWPRACRVDLPGSRASALDQNDKPIEISLDAKGAVFLDDKQIPDHDTRQPAEHARRRTHRQEPRADLPARRPRARLRPGDEGDGRAQPPPGSTRWRW